jgi:hypothetical protein
MFQMDYATTILRVNLYVSEGETIMTLQNTENHYFVTQHISEDLNLQQHHYGNFQSSKHNFHYLFMTANCCGDNLHFKNASGHQTSDATSPVSCTLNLHEKAEMTSREGKYHSLHRMGLL